MGQRVDIFVIRGGELRVEYRHWDADLPRSMIEETIAGETFKRVEAPMADCFCELAIIVDFDAHAVWWAADDLDQDPAFVTQVVPDRIGLYAVTNVGCYCGIYAELKRRGLWRWAKPKESACALLEEEPLAPQCPCSPNRLRAWAGELAAGIDKPDKHECKADDDEEIGDGVFRHVSVRRVLSWKGGGQSCEMAVSSSAECFVEPGETPIVPKEFTEPHLHMPLPYGSGFTRAQWEEIKREGDMAFAEFDARFASVVK